MHVLGETTGRSGVVLQGKEGGGVLRVYPREIFVIYILKRDLMQIWAYITYIKLMEVYNNLC